MIEWVQSLPNWQPYGDPQYFAILLLALVPVVIAMFYQRRLQVYESLVSVTFILFMFGGSHWMQLLALIGYLIWQTLIVFAYQSYRQRANQSLVFYASVLIALLPLIIVKITPAVIGVNSLFGFLGISYLTFRSVAMIMEMRDGELHDTKFWPFMRFMIFMPTISSGPIDRYRRFDEDYRQLPDRTEYLNMLEKAVWYLMLGAFYKFILAYIFGDVLLPQAKHMALMAGGVFNWPTLLVMYTYGFDLFFDFAGYSLFAIGISYIMGIHTPINFNKPFLSRDLKEFWNRWHMSLSFWFRDFVFMRLVYVLMKHKVFKNRNTTSSVAYLVNMLIMGFWHGVTWYYIAYGLFHGVGLVINDWWFRKKKRINKTRKQAGQPLLPDNKFMHALGIFVTFNVVMFSFLLFSGFLDQLWFHPMMHHGH
ncbi:D-alanyl-lipoteichoic acid biosynthesis protein DltB [Weissella diestrammenae]|uniref:Teichoic acid D-alanyltransferase n=1 Tax=Weissella diestrammenae TaxID=1162633 RepID=A0A7G9T6L7_9LACO|nr:D-alanyl-lipoteichoic acid biosynthesis protein DltB [Weissella diestrammenae]MCM0582979.1 D-alanyl-lipoteichoic acid biosynthesis protein DltB [Weissella diestrammenae]QNN75742.1 D-alanyl-lipoteichoic acid biosynthesis protein DltB [Weissella diestrammenae]